MPNSIFKLSNFQIFKLELYETRRSIDKADRN